MKKLFCILLSCILVFNSLTVVYADEHGGSGGSFDPLAKLKEEHPDLFDENGHMKPSLTQSVGSKLFDHMIVPDLIKGGEATVETLASLTGAITEFFNLFDNSDDDVSIKYKDNGQPVTESNYNENNFYITYSPKFLNGLNDKLQNKVYALDGYYLLEPAAPYSIDDVGKYLHEHGLTRINIADNPHSNVTKFFSQVGTEKGAVVYFTNSYGFRYLGLCTFPDGFYPYIAAAGNTRQYKPGDSTEYICYYGRGYPCMEISSDYKLREDYFYFSFNDITEIINNKAVFFCNRPIKVFYSLEDAKKYADNGQRSTYVPKLPSSNLTVPLGYANGTLNLPDFNINLDSLIGKAEADIQTDIDNQFKLYLDKLAEINVNPPQPTNPTPTPSGGGSGGDFGDGTTPTPAPDFTDGLKDTNDYLKQILEKVTSILQIDTDFSKSFETVSQNLCRYLESNNEKLDQIITAINALSNGKTEDEVNGCKYDFTQLSQSLTTLWNDSDQKFDQMIKLLEENNKYQEKIIGDLNDIKAILIAQTVLDAFQNRSKETADKAKEKFPTSIPWDIAMIVNTFSAEPEPLKFELPIKVNSLNINETITVDLSTGEWEKLGKLCRYMLSVLFILFLIQLSRKLFSNGGDE